MTKYIAYKTAQGNTNLPNGFITDHFETSQPTLDGYMVVPLDVFNTLFQNNSVLIRSSEVARGIVTVNPNTPAPVPRPASDAQHVPADYVSPTSNSPVSLDLFNQFLAWVAAGKPGAPPSNT